MCLSVCIVCEPCDRLAAFEGVPRLMPIACWDWLQAPHDPDQDMLRKWLADNYDCMTMSLMYLK